MNRPQKSGLSSAACCRVVQKPALELEPAATTSSVATLLAASALLVGLWWPQPSPQPVAVDGPQVLAAIETLRSDLSAEPASKKRRRKRACTPCPPAPAEPSSIPCSAAEPQGDWWRGFPFWGGVVIGCIVSRAVSFVLQLERALSAAFAVDRRPREYHIAGEPLRLRAA